MKAIFSETFQITLCLAMSIKIKKCLLNGIMRQCCILAWSFTFYNVATFLWSQKQLLKGARWNSSSENIGKTLKKKRALHLLFSKTAGLGMKLKKGLRRWYLQVNFVKFSALLESISE